MWETVLARRIQFAGIWILQTTLSFSIRDRRRVNTHTNTCVHTCTQTCEPHTRKDMCGQGGGDALYCTLSSTRRNVGPTYARVHCSNGELGA